MSEKKKGFWSWLGFGKKEEITEQVSQEQTIETDSQNIAENTPFVVEKHEIVSEFIEQKLDEAKHFVEEKLDVAEHIIKELEEKIEQSFELQMKLLQQMSLCQRKLKKLNLNQKSFLNQNKRSKFLKKLQNLLSRTS